MTAEVWGHAGTALAAVVTAIAGKSGWEKLRSNGMNAKLDTLIDSQGRIESKVDGIEGKVDRLDTRVRTVEEGLSNIQGWRSGRKEGLEERQR